MGGRKLHGLREGHQLAVVRRLRPAVQGSRQLAVDAVHRARAGEADLHRDEVLRPGLLPLPGDDADLQGDLLPVLLRVRRRVEGQPPAEARVVRPGRQDRRRRGAVFSELGGHHQHRGPVDTDDQEGPLLCLQVKTGLKEPYDN